MQHIVLVRICTCIYLICIHVCIIGHFFFSKNDVYWKNIFVFIQNIKNSNFVKFKVILFVSKCHFFLIQRFQFLRNPSSYIFPYLQHDKMLILCILVHLQFKVLAKIMHAPVHVYDANGFNNLGSAWCMERCAVGSTCSRARLLARDIDFECRTEYMSYHNFSKWIDRYFEKGTDWVSGIL